MSTTPTALTPTFPAMPRPRSPKRPHGSPTRSHTITKEIDPLIANLSAESVLLALQSQDAISTLGINSSTGDILLKQCIERASAHDKETGIRAALAGKKVKVWLNEVSGWIWPEEKFGPPGDDVEGSVSDASTKDGAAEYWGSLPARTVLEYERRIAEIRNDMKLLGVEELKRHVRAAHTGWSLSSLSRDEEGSRAGYVKLEDFEMVITSITVQLLPSLAWLGRLMDAWTVRLAVLRLVPEFLFAYEDTAECFAERPRLDEGVDTVQNVEVARNVLKTWKAKMDVKAPTAGKLLDRMLDLLEGSADRISDSWIDDLEGLERDSKNAFILQMKDLDAMEHDIYEREQSAWLIGHDMSTTQDERPLTAQKSTQPGSMQPFMKIHDTTAMTEDLTTMARALDGAQDKMYTKTTPPQKLDAAVINNDVSDLADLGRTLGAAQQGFYRFAAPAGEATDTPILVNPQTVGEDSDGASDLKFVGQTLNAAQKGFYRFAVSPEAQDEVTSVEHKRQAAEDSDGASDLRNMGQTLGTAQKSFYRFAVPVHTQEEPVVNESDGQSLAAMAILIDSAQGRYYRSLSNNYALEVRDHDLPAAVTNQAKSINSSSGSEPLDFHDALGPERVVLPDSDMQAENVREAHEALAVEEELSDHKASAGPPIDEELKLSPVSSEDSEREHSSIDENESETSTLSGRRSSDSPDHSDGIFDVHPHETPSNLMTSPTTTDITVFDTVSTTFVSNKPTAERIFEDKLTAQIHTILDTVPVEISLRTEPLPETETNDIASVSAISLRDADPFEHPSPEKPSRLTLIPAFTKQSKVRFSYGDNNIKLYYLHQSGRAPIRLYVRPIGDSGRVMVRVGGGWADLAEYLKEYVSHHSNVLSPDGTLSVRDMGSIASPRFDHGRATPTAQSPSRPTTPTFHNISPLDIKKMRRKNSSPPSLSRSVSRTSGDSEALGLAGPRARSANLSADKQAWLDNMMMKVSRRSVSEKTSIGVEEMERSVRRVYLTRNGEK